MQVSTTACVIYSYDNTSSERMSEPIKGSSEGVRETLDNTAHSCTGDAPHQSVCLTSQSPSQEPANRNWERIPTESALRTTINYGRPLARNISWVLPQSITQRLEAWMPSQTVNTSREQSSKTLPLSVKFGMWLKYLFCGCMIFLMCITDLVYCISDSKQTNIIIWQRNGQVSVTDRDEAESAEPMLVLTKWSWIFLIIGYPVVCHLCSWIKSKINLILTQRQWDQPIAKNVSYIAERIPMIGFTYFAMGCTYTNPFCSEFFFYLFAVSFWLLLRYLIWFGFLHRLTSLIKADSSNVDLRGQTKSKNAEKLEMFVKICFVTVALLTFMYVLFWMIPIPFTLYFYTAVLKKHQLQAFLAVNMVSCYASSFLMTGYYFISSSWRTDPEVLIFMTISDMVGCMKLMYMYRTVYL